MSEDRVEQLAYEIRVEGGMSDAFLAAFPEMTSAELAPCVVLVVEAPCDTDAADLALRVRALGQRVVSVRRCSGTGSAGAATARQEPSASQGHTPVPRT